MTIKAHPNARIWYNGVEVPNFTGTHQVAIAPPGPQGGWVQWEAYAILEDAGDGFGSPAPNPLANPDAEATLRGAVWVPPTAETLAYDAAGNRESSSQWDYGWDAKNQLVHARSKDYDTAAQGYDLTFTYDAEGRRVSKHCITYQNGVQVAEKTVTFVWDGWDLLYERHQLPSGLTTLERKYLWGPDLADGAAGGAGGLLLIGETKGNTTTNYIPIYDGTGHVVALTDINKNLHATYAYGPFGEKIYATGDKANSNPWRWATKYLDEETGLYYFGHRFYDPITGQWLSREPLGESESVNLYAYCGNDPVNKVDVKGLASTAVGGGMSTTDAGTIALLNFSTNIEAYDADWWAKASETEKRKWEMLVMDAETAKIRQLEREYEEYKSQFNPIAVISARSTALRFPDPDAYLFYRASRDEAFLEKWKNNPSWSHLEIQTSQPGFIHPLDSAYERGGEKAVRAFAAPFQVGSVMTNLGVEMSPAGAISAVTDSANAFGDGKWLAGSGLLALTILDAGVPGKIPSTGTWGRNRAASSIRNFRADMRASGMSTVEINSYVKAFELESFQYGRNLNPFNRHYRHFTAGERAGGSWVHGDASLLSADALTRKTRLALPESNLATGTLVTRISFLRKRATGIVAPQPSSFTGLPSGISTGGASQVYVPGMPWLNFTPVK